MVVLDYLLTFSKVFAVGGLMCMIAQLLIIKTKLTPARILVIFLLAGILLETVGLFEPIKKFAQSGITIPIIGFGASLAKGAIKAVMEYGFVGAFAGGLIQTAFGVGVALVASYFITLIFSSKTK